MYLDLLHKEKKYTARFIAPAAVDWFGQSSGGRVFQVFDRSCNLINSGDTILSLVSTKLGPGPFAITVEVTGSPDEDMPGFWEDVTVNSRVRISTKQIRIAFVQIDLSKVDIWNPKPAWEAILPGNLAQVHQILNQMLYSSSKTSIVFNTLKNGQLISSTPRLIAAQRELSAGVQQNDLAQAKVGAQKMAGSGPGLTPAGDDFLMGFIYSLWSQWDSKRAQVWATELVQVAKPLTTRLSANWLEAAANGEAAEPWHQLVEAIIKNDPGSLFDATARISEIGHSSGSDALTGYIAGLTALSCVQSA